MNLLKKYASLLAFAALAFGTAACSDDDGDYAPAGPVEGAQVYFSNDNATSFALGADDSSVAVDVLRGVADEAVEVPVLVTIDSEYASLFNVPSIVEFEAGVEKTQLVITFDRSKLEDGASYAIGLQIDDESMTTPYGASTLAITVSVPEPWVSLGTGLFSDAFMFDNFYKLEIQQHKLKPTFFRVVNPYAGGLLEEGYYDNPADCAAASEYFEFILMKPGNSLAGIPITMDNLVYFDPVNTGFFNTNNNYNQYVELLHPVNFTSLRSEAAWTYNKVVSWQDADKTLPAVVQIAPYYYMDGLGGWNKTQEDGWVTIVFPGVELTDYSVEVAYAGRFTDPENNNFAVATVEGGEDVEYIEVGMGAGDDAEAILEAILAGEIETVKVEGKEGKVPFAVEEDGTYTFVAISYGAGEAQETSAATFNFWIGTAPELGPLETVWTKDDLNMISKNELFKQWYMWARNNGDKEGNTDRQPMNIVTFSENTEDDGEDVDAINVSGLSLGFVEDDTMTWEYYRGVIYNLGFRGALGTWNGYTVSPFTVALPSSSLYYVSNYQFIGGIVDEGYIAMVSNNANTNYNGFYFAAFSDAELENLVGYLAWYYDIMFEDPAVSELSPAAAAAPKASMSKQQLKSLADKLSVRENYVETDRGKAHRMIDEMLAKRAELVPASADATVKTFRGTVKGLSEVPAKGRVTDTLMR